MESNTIGCMHHVPLGTSLKKVVCGPGKGEIYSIIPCMLKIHYEWNRSGLYLKLQKPLVSLIIRKRREYNTRRPPIPGLGIIEARTSVSGDVFKEAVETSQFILNKEMWLSLREDPKEK